MTRIKYEDWKPGADALAVLRQATAICQDYQTQGYDLTLRQLYYQFVARGLIPNTTKSYKRLGDIINRGRLAGLLDWAYIVDRTRDLAPVGHWDSPQDILDAVARQYKRDKWATSSTRVEVWVEKEALAGVVQRAAHALDCAYFSCRGYVSQSELWAAGQRLGGYIEGGQRVLVLHLGDHDPSGIDMTRDIEARLRTFIEQDYLNAHAEEFVGATVNVGHIWDAMKARVGGKYLEVRRIALNMDQVEQYDPPPNPAKMTDSRFASYEIEHGYESWELDALDPAILDALIREQVMMALDETAYAEVLAEQRAEIAKLRAVAANWEALDLEVEIDEGDEE